MPIGYEHCAKFCAAHPDQSFLAEHAVALHRRPSLAASLRQPNCLSPIGPNNSQPSGQSAAIEYSSTRTAAAVNRDRSVVCLSRSKCAQATPLEACAVPTGATNDDRIAVECRAITCRALVVSRSSVPPAVRSGLCTAHSVRSTAAHVHGRRVQLPGLGGIRNIGQHTKEGTSKAQCLTRWLRDSDGCGDPHKSRSRPSRCFLAPT